MKYNFSYMSSQEIADLAINDPEARQRLLEVTSPKRLLITPIETKDKLIKARTILYDTRAKQKKDKLIIASIIGYNTIIKQKKDKNLINIKMSQLDSLNHMVLHIASLISAGDIDQASNLTILKKQKYMIIMVMGMVGLEIMRQRIDNTLYKSYMEYIYKIL